jgi:predicted secreted Zn-dependent protease
MDSPANIEVGFQNAQMNRIVATFTQPPALSEAVAQYEKQFGPPIQKSIASNAFDTSTVVWSIRCKKADLKVTLAETQGTLEITYALAPQNAK